MKIFISWSGPRSRAVAEVLKRWIPDTVQQVQAWMSEHDIDAGSRWCTELVRTLEDCRFGIICLTPENQDSSWLLFEAGCLAKSSQVSRVVPYLYGLSASDVPYPLAQFQAVESSKSGTFKLIQTINESAGLNIANDRLDRLFEKWWPDLENSLLEIPPLKKDDEQPLRSERELLEELLGLARGSASRKPNFSSNRHRSKFVEISIAPSLSVVEGSFKIKYDPEQTVSSFLDEVYYRLSERLDVPAYEYGTFWLLQDIRSGYKYDDIGIEYCRSHGRRIDARSIESVGINSSAHLQAISAR